MSLKIDDEILYMNKETSSQYLADDAASWVR